MMTLRRRGLLLAGAAFILPTTAAFGQTNAAFSQPGPGCDGAWSNGQCWANTITNPPSFTPPVAGQFVEISPVPDITLDTGAQVSTLDVFGTLTQPAFSLTADNVVVSPAGTSAGTYNLSGGVLTVGGSSTFDIEIGGAVNQSGGAVVATQAINLDAVPFTGRIGTYNLSDGDINANGLIIGNGGGPLGVNSGIFNQSGGTVTFTGPVSLGGPFDPAPTIGGIGTYTISDGELNVSSSIGFGVVVGGTGQGTVSQSGGIVTIMSGPTSGGLELGRSVGGSGTYVLNGGKLSVEAEDVTSDGYVYVGNAGTGTFTQTDGEVAIEGTLTLGKSAGGSGTYNLSDGTLEADHIVIQNGAFTQSGGEVSIDTNTPGPGGGSLTIFSGGVYQLSAAGLTNDSTLDVEDREILQGGIFNQTGGTNKADGALLVNGGQYSLSGIGSQLTIGDDVTVNSGSIIQTGGSASFGGDLKIDGGNGGAGSYSLSGLGNLAVANDETIGESGSGSFTHTAGLNSVSGSITLGHTESGNGTYTLSGSGILTAGGDIVFGDAEDSTIPTQSGGRGTFVQSGGAVTVSGTVTLGADMNGSGTWSLSGGSLTVATNVVVGGAGRGVFVQSGGTLAIDGDLSVSAAPGSAGTFTLSDGTVQLLGNERIGLVAGAAPSRDNEFIQSGGIQQIGNTLLVGAGGGGRYTLSGGSLQALNETVGALGTGIGVFNQSGGVNTIADVLTIGTGGGTSGTYNLSSGIINAGTPSTQGLVNNDTLNVTGPSLIAANVLNNASGRINVSGATLNITGTITNFGTVTMDPSTVTVHDLVAGGSGVLTAGAGDVLKISGNFTNDSVQNTAWNTDEAELDFIGGGTHVFNLAGRDGAGFANNFSWGTLLIGDTDTLDLEAGSGDALYVKILEGLDTSGDMITNVFGSSGLFLYYDPAFNPLLAGDYFFEGGGELLASGGSVVGAVPEPSTLALLLSGLFVTAAARRAARRQRAGVVGRV